MHIIAFDIATKTGWCESEEVHGVWDFKLQRDESPGMKLIRFRAKIRELFDKSKPDCVGFERPAGRNTSSIIHESRMIGILEEECTLRGIPYKGYSSSEIKRLATGKGNASKKDVLDAALKIHPEIEDDNEADAYWLWRLINDQLNK